MKLRAIRTYNAGRGGGTLRQIPRKSNIGAAFTYNEPLIGYEFVRDTAKLVREKECIT